MPELKAALLPFYFKTSTMKSGTTYFISFKNTLLRAVALSALLLMQFAGMAQNSMPGLASQKVQMADGLRSSGKLYVVVAVLLTILTGLFIYLYRLDKKISKLEKK